MEFVLKHRGEKIMMDKKCILSNGKAHDIDLLGDISTQIDPILDV